MANPPNYSNFKQTGTFGNKRTEQLKNAGLTQDQFKTEFGLNKNSSSGKIKDAFGIVRERANNIDNPRQDGFTLNDPGQSAGQGATDLAGQVADAATSFGIGAQAGYLPQIQQNIGGSSSLRDQLSAASMGMQQAALNPNAQFQQQQSFLQPRADQRISDVQNYYGANSAQALDLGKQLAGTVTNFDELGVSGTSEGQALGKVVSDYGQQRANALLAAGEANRGEALDERSRIAEVNQSLAGTNLQGSLESQNLINQLFGVGSGIGQNIATQGLQAGELGLKGEELDLAARNQEMDRQLAEKTMQTNLIQQFIGNKQNYGQARRNKQFEDMLFPLLYGYAR
jgi:hypothetical protein